MNIVLSKLVETPERTVNSFDWSCVPAGRIEVVPASVGMEYYVASTVDESGKHCVTGKYVKENGLVRDQSKAGPFKTGKDAESRCRTLAKMKVRKKGFAECQPADYPDCIARHLQVPPGMRMTSEELLLLMREVSRERYVTFKTIVGLEEFFDLGVEYLAKVTDDACFVVVYDRFGEMRSCLIDRMASIVETEDARVALGMKRL